MDLIYLDNNATTPLALGVLDRMRPHLEHAGNAASAHRFGRKARQALEDARECVAALLGAHAEEVIFTSGATEANNLALAEERFCEASLIVASPMEHPSVAEPMRRLGERVRYLRCGADGRVISPLSP